MLIDLIFESKGQHYTNFKAVDPHPKATFAQAYTMIKAILGTQDFYLQRKAEGSYDIMACGKYIGYLMFTKSSSIFPPSIRLSVLNTECDFVLRKFGIPYNIAKHLQQEPIAV